MCQHAPGKHYKEGITLTDLFKMFPDDETAMKWFESRIWKNGRKCPDCGNPDTIESKHKTMPYSCHKCRSFFSVKKGTVMESSKIGYQKWAIGTYLVATNLKGVSSMKIHRDLGMTQKSAWFMIHRLRESWKKLAGVDGMQGPVEIDEAFFGGLEKNKHANRKGVKSKTAVVGIRDRPTNKITVAPVPETTKIRLESFVDKHVKKDAKKYTDENHAYTGLTNHESVRHTVGEYVRGMAHTNGLESFWSMIKRGHDGVFHHMSEPHLHRYVNEFAGRHNIREMDTIDMMGVMVAGMAGSRLTYKQLTSHV